MALACAGCSAIPPETGRIDEAPSFDTRLYARTAFRDLNLEISEREVVDAGDGVQLARVPFSFISYQGYPADGDVRRSTGAVFFPLGQDGSSRSARPGEVVLTEYPPGASVEGFDLFREYGQRPALELGIPGAIVDLRGPVLRDLGHFENPDAADTASFRSEEQFAYAMLRSYQTTGDFGLLWEQRVGDAWLRAIRAVDEVVAQETSISSNQFVLVGERRGALGAAQAASVDDGVRAIVDCGWPLDWMDYHFVRWRRWERGAFYYPLAALSPSAYSDSRDLLSFLSSTFAQPDPGCPSCVGSGARWLAQFDISRLQRGPLAQVPLLLLVGDSDPDLPIDLEARASAPPELIAALPPPAHAPASVPRGPFAQTRRLPFADLRYLQQSTSTLANPQAAEAVIAFIQHVDGFRDVPGLRIEEQLVEGDVQVTVTVVEGNATITGVEARLLEIEDKDNADFKASLHRQHPVMPAWQRVDAIYAGHEPSRTAFSMPRWRADFPVNPGWNQAYYVVVRTRVGAVSTSHSLPIRAIWNLGDPAAGPVRF